MAAIQYYDLLCDVACSFFIFSNAIANDNIYDNNMIGSINNFTLIILFIFPFSYCAFEKLVIVKCSC